jgi:hypothetical protein
VESGDEFIDTDSGYACSSPSPTILKSMEPGRRAVYSDGGVETETTSAVAVLPSFHFEGANTW